MKLRTAVMLVAGLLCGAWVWAEEFDLPKPVEHPGKAPAVPAGEKSFFWMYRNDVVPGVRIWSQWMRGNLWHYGTTQSVGDGAGMYIYAPAGGNPRTLCAMDTGVRREEKDGEVVRDDLKDWAGICLWIKGDGSDARAVISTGYEGSKMRFVIPLKETKWHKVFMPWDKWEEPITGHFWYLNFGLERDNNDTANWYIVDRVNFYKEEKTEAIQPTPDVDPPGMLPARAFVSGREHIAKTHAKLEAKKPVTIVIMGDSIAAGAQLGYTAKEYNQMDTQQRCMFASVLAERLREAYGYDGVSVVLRAYDMKKKTWSDKSGPREDKDLTIVNIGAGGGQSTHGLSIIEEGLKEKPDLFIWEFGTNDVTYGGLGPYAKATEEALRRVREAGAERILLTPPPTPGVLPVEWMNNQTWQQKAAGYCDAGKRIAKEQEAAVGDLFAALNARGAQFVGDLYSDGYHPNHLGHEMIADVLNALITNRDVRIWIHGPAAEKAGKVTN